MAKPLPVTVYGAVTPISPNVRVTALLSGAEVTIVDNVTPIGHADKSQFRELQNCPPFFQA
jgi:hypothetical protein